MINLRKLSSIAEIPINDLKSKIVQLKTISLLKDNESWLYVIGGGTGSGLLHLVILVSLFLYWRHWKYLQNEARSTNLSGICTGLEILNVKHTWKGAKRADDTVLGQGAVRIQGSMEHHKKVLINNPVYCAEASALLDQLKELGVDVTEHHRKQMMRQFNVLSSIEY